MPVPRHFESLRHLVSNTPMLAIRARVRGRVRMVYANAEHFNLTGSIKDRMAYGVLRRAYADSATDSAAVGRAWTALGDEAWDRLDQVPPRNSRRDG